MRYPPSIKIVSIFAGSLLLILCSIQAYAGEDDEYLATEHYNQGVTYHKQGYIDSAISEYKEAISLNSGLSEAYYNLGIIYAEKKEYAEATTMFKRVTEIKPYNYGAHYNLGIMYSESEAPDNAIYELERAVSLDENKEQAHLALGSLYAKNKQDSKAISEFRKAYAINPANYKVKEVIDSYDHPRYVQTAPVQTSSDSSYGWIWLLILAAIFGWKFILAMFNRTRCLLKSVWDKFKNPINRAKRFILNAKKFKDAKEYNKAQALAGEALDILTSPDAMLLNRHYKSGSISNPSEMHELQISACYLYAKTAYLSKVVAVDDILSKLKKVVSWDFSILYLLGELAYAQNDFRKSIDYFSKLAASGKNEMVNLWLGILNYKLSNFSESLLLLKSVNFPIQKSSIKDEYLCNDIKELSIGYLKFKGLGFYACKKWGGVIECFELMKKEYAIDADLKFYLARSYLNLSNYAEALKIIDECIALEPNDSDLLIERSRIYRRMNNLGKAGQDIHRAAGRTAGR